MFTRPTIRLVQHGRRSFTSTSAVAAGKGLGTLLGCSAGGYLLSEHVLTDDRLASWGVYETLDRTKETLRSTIGGMTNVAIPRVDAFSTPDSGLHAHALPWESDKWYKTYDHASYVFLMEGANCLSVRRGYQVYKEVCAACHAMGGIAFRNLVGVAATENEMKVYF
jgi:hypothetical protein